MPDLKKKKKEVDFFFMVLKGRMENEEKIKL